MVAEQCRIVVLRLEHEASRCTKCFNCVKYCPVQALEVRDGSTIVLKRELCIACLGCMAVCEQQAIRLVTDWVCGDDI